MTSGGSRPARTARALALVGSLAAISAASATLPACVGRVVESAANPGGGELRGALRDSPDRDLQGFYAAAEFRPLWFERGRPRPEAYALIRLLAEAEADGLDPQAYAPERLSALLKAGADDAEARARAELALSRAFADYVVDLRRPVPDAAPIVTDPAAVGPVSTPRAVLEAAARAPDLSAHLAEVRRMNPVYEQLRTALATYRARWSVLPQLSVPPGPTLEPGAEGPRVAALRRRLGLSEGDRYDDVLADAVSAFQTVHGLEPTGAADLQTIQALNAGAAPYERRILANLERVRALPSDPGRRFVVVDAAAARLDLYEDGRVVDTMKVIVGKPEQPTPSLAGVIRYAVFAPYWNVPEDLARDRIARKVLAQGPGYLRDQRLEVLSDWSADARVLAADEVDWAAAAAGLRSLRVRQKPGPGNMMGAVKLMLPNTLGVYLHDTPERALFDQPRRTFSSGCVRLEDAARLTRRLVGTEPDVSQPDRRVDLAEPVPVYIVYLTAAPGLGGVEFREDVYGRDPALMAALEDRGRATTLAGPAP